MCLRFIRTGRWLSTAPSSASTSRTGTRRPLHHHELDPSVTTTTDNNVDRWNKQFPGIETRDLVASSAFKVLALRNARGRVPVPHSGLMCFSLLAPLSPSDSVHSRLVAVDVVRRRLEAGGRQRAPPPLVRARLPRWYGYHTICLIEQMSRQSSAL